MGLKSRREAVDYRAGGLQCGGHLVPLAGEPNVFPLCPSTIHVLRDGQHPSSLHRVLRPSVQVAFTYARPVSLGFKRRSWGCASPSMATTARHPDPRTPDVCVLYAVASLSNMPGYPNPTLLQHPASYGSERSGVGPEFEKGDGRLRTSLQQRLPGAEGPPEGCSTGPRHTACGGPLPSSAEGPCVIQFTATGDRYLLTP